MFIFMLLGMALNIALFLINRFWPKKAMPDAVKKQVSRLLAYHEHLKEICREQYGIEPDNLTRESVLREASHAKNPFRHHDETLATMTPADAKEVLDA